VNFTLAVRGEKMMFRIGHGYDTHSFEEGRPLVLGGVRIPSPFGMKAHSDGDVIIHAVCDALLGAMAMGDIGQHFPDSDSQFANADSRFFIHKIMQQVTAKSYKVNNIDITILAQIPKLLPYTKQMRENLATDLNIGIDDINIKATTTEKMGFIGRKEGIACYAVILLQKIFKEIE
jgi:2-C-methyl-D-erythritol 2,4-cyclodiphosphate synthase